MQSKQGAPRLLLAAVIIGALVLVAMIIRLAVLGHF
jgi:hypothetical protein